VPHPKANLLQRAFCTPCRSPRPIWHSSPVSCTPFQAGFSHFLSAWYRPAHGPRSAGAASPGTSP
jgi:hypothetical protein